VITITNDHQITVYHFELFKDSQTFAMPVIANPVVERIVARYHLTRATRALPAHRIPSQRHVA
jgi:hypothetical protein